MANIMINTACNLRCPYCFADECKASSPDQNMSIENFKAALEFITRTEDRVGIIGGEPTIHPQFRQLFTIALNNPKVNRIILFTNGTHLDEHLDLLAQSKVSVLVNFNSPTITGQENYERTLHNIEYLLRMHPAPKEITLGYNLYEVDPDIDYMVDALVRFKRKSVRFSTVVPNSQGKRGLNPLAFFEQIKPGVFKFFSRLKRHGIMPRSDCNYIPICTYNETELKWLQDAFLTMEAKTGEGCNLFNTFKCGEVVDILPDLMATRCFGLSENLRVGISDFADLNDLKNYFDYEFQSLAIHIPSDEKCKNCYSRKTQACNGGCLGFKADKIAELKKRMEDL